MTTALARSQTTPPKRAIEHGSQDIMKEKIRRIREIIPECFTEGVLNIENLRKMLGQTLDAKDEKYSFDWAGRNETYKTIQRTSKGTLVPLNSDSVNFGTTEHIFIEGDNLEVLKIIQKSYFKKIKMIYIDPPYNKGSDAIYNDNFTENENAYWERTGKKRDGVKLTTNPETRGRYHSAWISFMYARMLLARNLLCDNGIIFVSIGDDEIHNMRLIMNEVFGEENFIASFVWEGGRKNDSKFVSVSHDYIVCYAINYNLLRVNNTTWRLRKDGIDTIYDKVKELKQKHRNDYGKITEEIQKWYSKFDKKDREWYHRHYRYVDEKGIFFGDNISWPGGGGPKYTVTHPVTKKPVKTPSRGWIYSNKDKMMEEIKNGNILFGKDECSVPMVKKYLHNVEDQVMTSVIYKDRRNANKKLRKLMCDDVFDNPKDSEVLQDLIRATTSGNDIILDFFAGSGSTAQAVLDQNIEDEQNRKFMCVQIEEITPEKSIARKNGYKTISDITKSRLQRVIEMIKKAEPTGSSKLDLGFKAFKLSTSNFRTWDPYAGKNEAGLKKQLEIFESTLREGADPEAVIYECILREGFSLNSRIRDICSKPNKVYRVEDASKGTFYITLDRTIDQKGLEQLGLGRDDTLICMDSALDDDQKTNMHRTFILKTM